MSASRRAAARPRRTIASASRKPARRQTSALRRKQPARRRKPARRKPAPRTNSAHHTPAPPRRKRRRKLNARRGARRAPRAITQPPPPRAADPSAKRTGRRRNYYTGEFLAEARRRIETTLQSTTAIALDLGTSRDNLWRLVRREGWVRPAGSLRLRGLSPAMRLAAQADALMAAKVPPTPDPSPPLAPLAGGGEHVEPVAPPSPDNAAIDRLEAAVLSELGSVETMRASLGNEPQRPVDAERTARTLSVLTETLAKLRRLRLAAQPQQQDTPDDDYPADIDEFRNEFARRIRAFVASRAGDGGAGAAGPAVGSDPV